MINFANSPLVFWNYHPVHVPSPQILAPVAVAAHIDDHHDFEAQNEATVLANDFVQRLQSAQLPIDSGSSYLGAPFIA